MKYKGIYYFKKLEPQNKENNNKIFKATVKQKKLQIEKGNQSKTDNERLIK